MRMITFLAAAVRRYLYYAYKSVLACRAIRSLLCADGRLLKDIGLTRADIADCLSIPRTINPSDMLMARRADRALENVTIIEHPARWRGGSPRAAAPSQIDRTAA